MAPLTIRLLGSPDISFGGRALSFRTRKTLALLIYLVVEGGMHSRESLMALLWPETEAHKAAVTLRTTLTRLRRSLQPAGQFLISEGGKVGFDFDRSIDLDLGWLAAAVLPEFSPDNLTAILHLDRGEFLAGFSLPDAPDFDIWAAIEREACQRRVDAVYDRLTQQQLNSGHASAAIETAARWHAGARLNETACRRLMAAQALSGDRAAALRTYAQCQAAFQAELGVQLARETVELAERIKKTSQDRPGREDQKAPSPTALSSSALPFVGRANEHRQLVAAYGQTMAAGAHAVVVIGAAGVGKTRLVQTFLEWSALESPAADRWHGRVFETGGRLPYEPVIEALRLRLERENAPEDLLEDVWLAELSQLMPELRGRYPDLPLPMTGDASFVRSRLFAAVAALGSALAARQRAVLVLDDLQWADADTLDMVHYAARRWSESSAPILLLLTVRQENYAADPTLREWLARLARDVPVSRLLLDTLSATAVQELVATLEDTQSGPSQAAQSFADWLWAETNGLAFFIEALLQMLVEQGTLTAADEPGRGVDFAAALGHVHSVVKVPLPPGVRDVILARLAKLTAAEAALLLAAAVMGRECTFRRLCQVAGSDELAALPALEALLNGRLLAENGTARRPYTLAHDHIRQVVYSESREARRRVLHRRALIALEADGAPAAECAYHAVASLLDGPAFRYSLAAGDESYAAYALQESLAHYDRAREAARMMGAGITGAEPAALLHLYQNRGRALELVSQYEAAQANYQEMLDVADARNDLAMRLAGLTSLCIVRATQTPLFNISEARVLAEEALALAQHLGDKATEARALWGLLLVESWAEESLQIQKGLAYGLRSLELARELDLKEQIGFTCQDLAHAYRRLNRLADAARTNQAALAIWQELGNLPMLIDAYSQQQFDHFQLGEFAAALGCGEEALRLSRSIDHVWSLVIALGFTIATSIEIGDAGRAAELIAERARLTAAIGAGFHPTYTYLVHHHQLSLALSLGVPDRVVHLSEDLVANRHEMIPAFFQYMLAAVIQVELAQGNSQRAQLTWDENVPDWRLDGSPVYLAGPLSAAELELLLAQNKLQRALERAHHAADYFRRIGCLAYVPEVLWLQGRAEMGLAQWTQARETLTQALDISRRNGEHRLRWRILSSLAAVAEAEAKPGEADRYRKMGQEVIDSIANHIDDEELRGAFLAAAAG